MEEISKETGREYKPFKYRGAADADRVIIAMASVCQTAEETVDYLVEKRRKSWSYNSSSIQTFL